MRSAPKIPPAPHRIPLGLLLLSRQQLSPEQLREALAVQRRASHGRIGEWLQRLGFASEQQITAGLARQWSCPILRSNTLASISLAGPLISLTGKDSFADKTNRNGKTASLLSIHIPQIPVTLMESFVMIPVDYVASTSTLHVAFGEGVDYGLLNAIEQMLGCRTEPCMALPSLLRERLDGLSRRRGETEVVFEEVADAAESSRIIRSYSVRVSASAIRLAVCGPHLWVRLTRPASLPIDLLFPSPRDTSTLSSLQPASTAV